MAKLENQEGKSSKKNKGKKRKHTETSNAMEDEDEVASKSVVLETENVVEPESETNIKKATKRKNNKQQQSQVKEKRKRTTEEEHVSNDEADNDEEPEEELHEPTWEELCESEKPENTKAILTVRQKKKQKQQERLAVQKDQTADRDQKRNEEYLRKWKHARTEWKYEKLRQISIQQTALDENKISTEMWPIAVEYLSGTKGAAKEKICKLAEEVIDQLDKESALLTNATEQQSIVNSIKYQRARDLLQNFD